jgi:hypothetical protein
MLTWSRPIYQHAVHLKTNVIGPIDHTSSMATLPFATRISGLLGHDQPVASRCCSLDRLLICRLIGNTYVLRSLHGGSIRNLFGQAEALQIFPTQVSQLHHRRYTYLPLSSYPSVP